MKISVIGVGYVGLVTGACMANFGFEVVCVDNDEEKINNLKKNEIPIYEEGLNDIVESNTSNNRLKFTTNIKEAIETSDVIYIAVGTPQKEDGSANLKYISEVAKSIGKHINNYKVIITKSTVPVGTYKKIKKIINNNIKDENLKDEFDMVSNPEFLRQGSAVNDFNNPDRIIIGTETEKSNEMMKELYESFYKKEVLVIETNIQTAELIKYTSNAFLAMKISYINEIANLCEKVDANILDIKKALGTDNRISPKFLSPGPGYGGSCFPKDTLALVNIAKENEMDLKLIQATVEINDSQKRNVVNKLSDVLGDLKNKRIGILGLSFKPNTDDMRESPAIIIVNKLAESGANLKVYDPIAMENAKKVLSDKVHFCENTYDVIKNIEVLVIITEWNEFKTLNFVKVKELMSGNVIFDLRNIYDKKEIEDIGLKYYGTGI